LDAAREQFLAGPGLAGDEHGGAGDGGAVGQRQHRQGGRIASEKAAPGLDAVGPLAKYPAHQGAQRGRALQRLGEVVSGPQSHRLHRTRDGAVGGHHHHRGGRLYGPRPPGELEPVHPRHPLVGEQEVDRASGELGQRLLAACRLRHPVSLAAENLHQ
jgi:hypothetical protein